MFGDRSRDRSRGEPGLKIDAVTAVLLAVAVVPWLGALFDGIELPGGTKFQYKRLVDRIEAAEERSARAGHAADEASRTARLAFVAGGSADDEGATGSTASGTVAQLAAEYTQVRERMASSPERTNLMEQIFADLVTATRREQDFDVEDALKSHDPGTRLAAYARLYARPDADHLDPLVEVVLGDEDRAFSRYWGFKTITAVVDTTGAGRMRIGDVDRLETCLSRLPCDSDRIGPPTPVCTSWSWTRGPRAVTPSCRSAATAGCCPRPAATTRWRSHPANASMSSPTSPGTARARRCVC
ncbi:hypothetical protein ACIQCF_23680 [Streptomyces sp. NPDC088353]|uniref:hypothetical protein n=1 Tax=Streptomyces sp. NPDC088353 TaxID=3365855 RepID=UPI0038109FA7